MSTGNWSTIDAAAKAPYAPYGHKREALAKLARLAKHEDRYTRIAVAEALGKIGTRAARKLLGQLAIDEDGAVRYWACEAFERAKADRA